jgi:hypothetical protein
MLLCNTYLNAKTQNLGEFPENEKEGVGTRLAWIDKSHEEQLGKSKTCNLIIPSYEKCEFRKKKTE